MPPEAEAEAGDEDGTEVKAGPPAHEAELVAAEAEAVGGAGSESLSAARWSYVSSSASSAVSWAHSRTSLERMNTRTMYLKLTLIISTSRSSQYTVQEYSIK